MIGFASLEKPVIPLQVPYIAIVVIALRLL